MTPFLPSLADLYNEISSRPLRQHRPNPMKTEILILTWILLQFSFAKDSATCNSQLGLDFASKSLANLHLESSSSSSSASSGRLNNPDGAWCFSDADSNEDQVFFTIDLGCIRFVSGFMTQGPPSSMAKKYTHNIPFDIKYGLEKNRWTEHHDDNIEMRSYVNSNPDRIESHSWHTVFLARYVQFSVDKQNMIIPEKGCLRFDLLGCGPELVPNTTLHVEGTERGRVTLSWTGPKVWTGSEWAPLLQSQFSVSYKDSTGNNVTINATEQTSAVISAPYFGVSYTFLLECVVPGMRLHCNKLSLPLYPSCPLNWNQNQHWCFYSDGSSETWTESRKKCANSLEEYGERKTGSAVEDGSTVWLGDQKCVETDGKCCAVVNLTALTRKTIDCPAEETKRQVCLVENRVDFCKIVKLQLRATGTSSVDITWTNELAGWHSINRSVSITKGRRHEIRNRLARDRDIYIDTEDDDWRSSSSVINLENLELNTMYSLFLVPEPRAGHTWANAFSAEFHLLSTGAVTSVPIDALIRWRGSITLRWEEVKAISKTDSVPASGYTLQYSKKLSSVLRNSTKRTETQFDVRLPDFGDEYEFVLFCHFGESTVIECGREELKSGTVNYKHRRNDDKWIVYTHDAVAKSWTEAEKSCSDRGGHLTSIMDAEEFKLVMEMSPDKKPFWIGGTNCGGKALRTWVDGLRWQFAARMTSFRDDKCCLRANYDVRGKFVWEGGLCDDRSPYVCKFQVETFTAPVTALQTTSSPTSVFVRWTKPIDQWQPSHYTVERCTKDLTCALVTRVSQVSAALVTGLEPATASIIRVSTVLGPLDATNPATIEAVTDESKMVVKLTKGGVATVEWTAKIAGGKSEEECRVSYHPVDRPEEETKVPGKASGTTVSGLGHNQTYKFTVSSQSGEGESDTIDSFVTIPECEKGQIRRGFCLHVGSETVSRQLAKQSCGSDGRLPDGRQLESQLELSTVSTEEKKEFWFDAGDEKACYKVVPHTQDPIAADCNEKLPLVCEKPVEMLLLPVLGLSATQIDRITANVTWEPPKSWRVAEYSVTVVETKHEIKESFATNCVLTDLEPEGTYTVRVVPFAESQTGRIQGPPTQIQFTMAATTTTPTTTLPTSTTTANTPKSSDDSTPTTPIKRVRSITDPSLASSVEVTDHVPVLGNVTVPENLKTFHIIGCSTLVALVTVALIIFLFTRTYTYRDVVSQVGFEISILVAHTFFLIWAVDSSVVDCKSMAICVHFFFTAAYSFLLMESLAIAKAITNTIPITLFQTWWHLFLFGWVPPLIAIGASAGIIMDDYPKIYPCWLWTSNENLLYASAIPIGILGGACLLLLLTCICFRPSSSYEVDEQSFTREKVLQMMRWVVLLLLVLTTVSWVCGVLGMEKSDENHLLIFIIFNILTGVCVIVLRCFGDAEVRQRIRAFCIEDKVHPEEDDDDDDDNKSEFKPPHKGPPSLIETIDLSPPTTDKTALTGPFAWDRYVFRP